MKLKTLAIANQKGGVGKTTTSINLSACLAERGKNVLLIDLDPQANATSGVGMEKRPGMSIYEALLGEGPAAEKVQTTSIKRLDLIASETDLAGAEVDVARMDNYLHRLKNALIELHQEQKYDFIILDCPPSLGVLTMNGLAAADALLIPLQCEYYALEGLSVITRLAAHLRSSGTNPELDIEGIVMTMFDRRTNLSKQVAEEVRKHFGTRVYDSVIPRTVRLSEAPSFGQPIITYDKNCTGTAAYRQLTREFLKRRKIAAAPAT